MNKSEKNAVYIIAGGMLGAWFVYTDNLKNCVDYAIFILAASILVYLLETVLGKESEE